MFSNIAYEAIVKIVECLDLAIYGLIYSLLLKLNLLNKKAKEKHNELTKLVKLLMSLDIIYCEKQMKLIELDDVMQFEFECDIMIDANMNAHFDDTSVKQVTDLLKEHAIDFVVKIGMNEQHQRTVNIQTNTRLSELFHYDLTSLMLHR